MDLFDLLQQGDINQLRAEIERLRRQRDAEGWGAHKVKQVAEENLELKLRLGLLVRILIEKRAFSAEEFAGLLAEARREQ